MIPQATDNWTDTTPVVLPDPQDFPGKLIEIQPYSSDANQEKTCYVDCVVHRSRGGGATFGNFSIGIEYDNGGFKVPYQGWANSTSVKTGRKWFFHSMYLNCSGYNDWFWVADQV